MRPNEAGSASVRGDTLDAKRMSRPRLRPAGEPVRMVVLGAGPMGAAWLRNVRATPGAELVGLVDLDTARA